MNRAFVIIFIFSFSGCSLFRPETIITFPDNKTIKISAGYDEKISVERNGIKADIDRRGRPTFIESFPDKLLDSIGGLKPEIDL